MFSVTHMVCGWKLKLFYDSSTIVLHVIDN